MPIYHETETTEADPIFDAQDLLAGKGLISPIASEKDVRGAVGKSLDGYLTTHSADFTKFQQLMVKRCADTCTAIDQDPSTIVSKNALSEVSGPVKTASGYAEDVFLEAAECRPIDANGLDAGMRLHSLAYDFNSRNAYNSSARGANLFAHIMALLNQKAGRKLDGVDAPDVHKDAVALISGHDTQLGALGGILGAHWNLSNGLVPDDMPPGGALVFDLYQDGQQYTVKLRFVYETMSQFTSKTAIPGGIVSVPVSCKYMAGQCSVGLNILSALALQFEANPFANGANFVQREWTQMTSDPVTLGPLSDPAWSQCK